MDAFALKKDNRKKFQDKEKLKRKHATPSDRKYRALNKTTEPEPEVPELQANHYRYHEDLSMTYQTQNDDDSNVGTTNKKLKEILLARQNNTDHDSQYQTKSPSHLTRKELDSMSVAELNRLLGNKQNDSISIKPDAGGSKNDNTRFSNHVRGTPAALKSEIPTKTSKSKVPVDLESEQDQLDELI
ncbi:uncharacterized protein LALA0_S06e07558g [Lachancea lanzarotensis]|uniref:LALA0S06e07558g1_1 n=1 Tax=Lachancea lanzarotensis TaxID=1245769 RepID=A0A0C7N4R9_9SACH|nr:uncharacterized protein LALA0_S06e07558g [Lachancea lanzarotensis]CEP62947.1 LALA0S06e07558g1_1 [Lachancea lanzarotensis]